MHQEREKGEKREFCMFENPASKGREMELSPKKQKKIKNKKKKGFFLLTRVVAVPSLC